ncbi:MAG TPA: TolC family protein, partial [Terriglobales bacterium]|nr:TolC family protein [Terriglobales bacterium]
MRFSQNLKETGRSFVAAVTLFTFSLSAFGQQPSPAPDKPQPQSTVSTSTPEFQNGFRHFPNPFAPYMPHKIADPAFTNTPRIEQLIKNGVLVISLNDAIAIALENNLDIAIARYNLNIADTDILRAKSGGSIRGVATGLVQGTPGGGQGGFGTGASGAGGTTSGAGGAGSGSSGLVTSTLGAGSAIEQFDPSISGTFQMDRNTSPLASPILTSGGATTQSSISQNNTTANLSYNQGFATGTALGVAFNNNRSASNSPGSSLSPLLSSNYRFTLRQHLLQGFGLNNQLRFIRIAKNNKIISDVGFKNQVISTVNQIQNIYWDLVNAYEDVKVKERSLGLANKTLSDNRKQVEIGTLAPIEIVRADSEMATRNQELIVSRTNLQLQQTLLKNALSRNLSDPTLAAIPVVPSDVMSIDPNEVVPPVEELLRQALAQRPDLEQSRIDLTNRDISKRAARNALLPTLDVYGFYGGSALAGDQNRLVTCVPAGTSTSASCLPAGSIGTVGGYTDVFGRFGDAPSRGVGITLNIPLRNRAAQADQIRSELEFRQAQLRFQQQQNTIGIEVRNAQFALLQNRARVEAAQQGRRLANESLEAESKKYSLGASTNFQVLQAQRDLALSESNLVTAMSAYEKSRVELDRVTGNTLARNSISLGDAIIGRVETMPNVPGVTPRGPDNPATTTPP